MKVYHRTTRGQILKMMMSWTSVFLKFNIKFRKNKLNLLIKLEFKTQQTDKSSQRYMSHLTKYKTLINLFKHP